MPDDGTLLIQDLMRFLPDGMTANSWAVKAGVSRTIWADIKRHGNPSRKTLERLLDAAGSSLAEFEALRIGRAARAPAQAGEMLAETGRVWRGAPLPPVPLLATSIAGEWGQAGSGIELNAIDGSKVMGYLERPARLAADERAYAVTVAGESMWPRFRRGRQLLISPAASLAVGDDVLVRLNAAAGDRAVNILIKELACRSTSLIELRQFNPDMTFPIETTGIESIHKVIGEAI